MTDREMLEFAAKAAGMEGMRYASPYTGMVKMIDPTRPDTTGSIGPDWNPLTDNNDAFRLMVRLRLEPRFIDNSHSNGAEPSRVMLHNIAGIVENIGDDPAATLRRVIVRAAAEIGKGMK